MKTPFRKNIIGLTIFVVLYFTLSQFFSETIIFTVLIVIMVGYIIFYTIYKWNDLRTLESSCKAIEFVNYVESKYKKNPEYYNLLMPYGLIYEGKIAEAKDIFNNFPSTNKKILEEKSFFHIYIKVKTKLAYYENDEDTLMEVLSEISNNEFKSELLLDYTRVFTLLNREDYETAIDILFKIIPKQLKRVHIIELEYFLALAYVKTDRKEDAKAVLEFMIKKDHKIVYTEKCRELLATIE